MHARHLTLLALAGLVATMLAVPAAGQSPSGPSVSVDSVAAAVDFASRELGDPMDYEQSTDMITDENVPTLNAVDMRFEAGQFAWGQGDGSPYVSPHMMTVPGAIPEASDGVGTPIDADTYTHVSARVQGEFAFWWFVCVDFSAACSRFTSFSPPGSTWRVVTLDLSDDPDWSGEVYGLRFPGSGRIDWLRLHVGGEVVPVSGSGSVGFDTNRDPGDNDLLGPPHGLLPPGDIQTGAFPSGTYHLYDDTGYGDTITVRDSPQPVVLDPDVTGGEDYATARRGDPWDLAQVFDVARFGNVVGAEVSDGVLRGTNATNDPFVELALAGPIDTTRYHRLTVTSSFDGPFDLADAAGGGTHGRIVFAHADDPTQPRSARELITYRSRPTATWDLSDPRLGGAVEPGTPAWDAAPATTFRWDPNEDRGPRRWRLDDVRLAADDEAQGAFTVRWHDLADRAGTRVRVHLDDDRRGFDGPVVAEVTQVAGENAAVVPLRGVTPGTYWLWLESDDGTDVGAAYATGPLQVLASSRLAGPDRVATSVVVSQEGFPDGATTALVASATAFPDALAGAALADAVGGPVLLNPADQLDVRVATELRRLGVTRVVVLGGESAQSVAVERALAATDGVTVERLSGATRYDTAAAVARAAVDAWQADGVAVGDEVVLASGEAFPDALAAGQLVAALDAPLLLTPPDRLATPAAEVIADLEVDRVVAVGGPVALADRTVEASGVPATRVAGGDRYATAVAAAERAVAAGADAGRVVVASGANFPDALSAGTLVAARASTLLLVAPDTLPDATARRLAELDAPRVDIVGGPGAITPTVERAIRAAVR